jgi:multidrug efflux system membrane fusion protein
LAQLLAFVIIGSAMAGVLLFTRNREVSPYTDDASIDADVVHIAASVSGRIVRLDVGENQLVKAGEIDLEPYRLRVELASAEQSAQALLDSQRRTVATETSNASIAADQVVQARYSLR